MKSLFLLLIPLLFLSTLLFSKSRLGEYYYGFGYSMIGGGKSTEVEGDALSLSLNSPASDIADFKIYLEYGTAEYGISEDSIWSLGVDYIYRFDNFADEGGMLRPFIGFGLGYFKDEASILLNNDGFSWNLIGGTEFMFTEEVSLSLGASYLGVWTDFSSTDLAFDLGLTWWINDIHGVALEYSYAFDSEVDYVGLKYLYSWQ